jgi:hypothetical protein
VHPVQTSTETLAPIAQPGGSRRRRWLMAGASGLALFVGLLAVAPDARAQSPLTINPDLGLGVLVAEGSRPTELDGPWVANPETLTNATPLNGEGEPVSIRLDGPSSSGGIVAGITTLADGGCSLTVGIDAD